MKRLFLALNLHSEAVQELVRLQCHLPAAGRHAAADQIHLTLHFLGHAEFAPVELALGDISAAPVPLEIGAVGSFQSWDEAVTVWAGVRLTKELQDLHVAMASALAKTGFRPETRPYCPHVTLARYKRGVSDTALAEFLTSQSSFRIPSRTVAEFVLYSSELTSSGPVYRRERTFALR